MRAYYTHAMNAISIQHTLNSQTFTATPIFGGGVNHYIPTIYKKPYMHLSYACVAFLFAHKPLKFNTNK